MLCEAFDVVLFYPSGSCVPDDILRRCKAYPIACGDVSKRWSIRSVVRFEIGCWVAIVRLCLKGEVGYSVRAVATGFDIPCLFLGWALRRRLHARWWVFCWDPPALSWRDRTDWFARALIGLADFFFRIAVHRADRLVLNIHPGLLSEISYTPPQGQLLQVVNGATAIEDTACWDAKSCDNWMIGVLSRGTPEKGFCLAAEAFVALAVKLPQARLRWIGEVSEEQRAWLRVLLRASAVCEDRFELTGPLAHTQALRLLSECGVLLFSYLDVPSLRWNYPLKLAEYFQLGRCVVAANTPGARAYVVDHETGRLFQAGATFDLTRVLGEVLGNGQAQARLGSAAKLRSSAFDWVTINRAIISQLSEESGDGLR